MIDHYPPIHQDPSLLTFVRAQLTDGSAENGEFAPVLPDEPDRDPGKLSWSAGALDGVTSHHTGLSTDRPGIGALAKRMVTVANDPDAASLRSLYDRINDGSVLATIDVLIAELFGDQYGEELVDAMAVGVGHEATLADLGLWLATTAPDREPTKLGIALLGMTGAMSTDAPNAKDTVSTVVDLGRHDEFTLFSVVALKNGHPDPNPQLFALAQATTGWGRVQSVSHMGPTDDPEVKEWLIRGRGYHNTIMDEYLALTAAEIGDLAGTLEDEPDRELLNSVGGLFDALCSPHSPSAGLEAYEGGARSAERYVEILEGGPHTERLDLGGAIALRRWLQSETEVTWPPGKADGLAHRLDSYVSRPEWEQLLLQDLHGDDPDAYRNAEHLARAVGIRTYDHNVRWLKTHPTDTYVWFQAWQQGGDEHAAELAELVRQSIDVDALASGASNDLGMGAQYAENDVLTTALSALGSHPNVGRDLLDSGLQSPVVRTRRAAVGLLASWGITGWTDDEVATVTTMVGSDPSEFVRTSAQDALKVRKGFRINRGMIRSLVLIPIALCLVGSTVFGYLWLRGEQIDNPSYFAGSGQIPATIRLDADREYGIWPSIYKSLHIREAAVVAPDGSAIPVELIENAKNPDAGGGRGISDPFMTAGQFRATAAGEYTFEVDIVDAEGDPVEQVESRITVGVIPGGKTPSERKPYRGGYALTWLGVAAACLYGNHRITKAYGPKYL